MSSLKVTVYAEVGGGIITDTASITRKFIGQPQENLKRWMSRQGGYREKELAKLPEKPRDSDTVHAIYRSYEKKQEPGQATRSYLGASQIGHPCERHLWYSFRNCSSARYPGRILRLFETGNLEEGRLVQNLKDIGCTIEDIDPQTGEQFSCYGHAGHFGGHADGKGLGLPEAPKTWHLLEFKTHNKKSFADLKKNGVKKSKPEHYCQMVAYMGLLKLKRALYLAVCKDDDYLHSERIRWEDVRGDFGMIMNRAMCIIKSNIPLPRISENSEHHVCKFCRFNELCHGNGKDDTAVPIDVSCRNCAHAQVQLDRHQRWSCLFHKKDLSKEDQAAACSDHLIIPEIIQFASTWNADPGENWVAYKRRDSNQTFRNSKHQGDFTSRMLATMKKSDIGF